MAAPSRAWLRKAAMGCGAIAVLAFFGVAGIGALFMLQQRSSVAAPHRLGQDVPRPAAGEGANRPRPSPAGRVVLDLAGADARLEPAPPGEPISVQANYDPKAFALDQAFQPEADGSWSYRVTFRQRRWLHVAVARAALGGSAPSLVIRIPSDLPVSIDGEMRRGRLQLELAGLRLDALDARVDTGTLSVSVSGPMPVPVDRIALIGRLGTIRVREIGNASPRDLRIMQGLGGLDVDLRGRWLRDADVSVQAAFGRGSIQLPRDVVIEGLKGRSPLRAGDANEVPRPVLRMHVHYDVGDLRIVD